MPTLPLDPQGAHARNKARLATPRAQRPLVLATTHPSSALGATSEAFSDKVEAFLDKPHEFFSGRDPLKPKLWREVMWKKYHAALMQVLLPLLVSPLPSHLSSPRSSLLSPLTSPPLTSLPLTSLPLTSSPISPLPGRSRARRSGCSRRSRSASPPLR